MANNQITPFQLTDQFTMDNFNQRINETNTALQNKADSGHTHDDRYYTETEVNNLLAGKAASSHTHAAGDVTSGTFAATGIKAANGTDYTTARIRNIQASTTDLTAGSSSLANGDIYLVYE